MSAFFEFVRSITYYLLFASLVGMAAPQGKHRQYVKLITGLILLFLFIQPLSAFVKNPGVPVTEWMTGASVPPSDYNQTYDWALQAAFERQLYLQLEALLTQNGYQLQDADIDYSEDYSRVTQMRVSVYAPQEPEAKRPFIRIEPVRIGQSPGDETPASDPAAQDIKKLIAGFYSLPVQHIHVEVMYR